MLRHAAVTASSSTSTADSLARAMAEVDRVLLIATSDFQDRMQQHQNVIDAAKAAGVKLLLGFTSRSLNDMVGPENAMMRDYLQTEALIREGGVPALIFRNALSLDPPPVSLGGPAVFTADHPGRELTDAAPDPARLLQHRVGHLERHLPRQLAQVTRREPPAGRRRRVRRGAEPGGGRGHRPRPRGRYLAHGRQPPYRQARHAARERDGLALMAEGRSNAAIAGILVVPSGPSRSTSGTSSASSAWHPRTPATAGCWPSSGTWSPEHPFGILGPQRLVEKGRHPGIRPSTTTSLDKINEYSHN